MNIKQLKEEIKNLPDDIEVILQTDAEGNNYSPLKDVDSNCIYVPNSPYSGDVYGTKWSAEDVCMTDMEWKELKRKPKSLVLVPVN